MGLFKQSVQNLTDEELMARVQSRDSRAFSVLYDRYSGRMVNYFYKMLWQDSEKAQDFAQELFTKLVQKPELYKAGRPFKTWLFSIANNMCKNEYRSAEVRKNTRHDLDRDVAGESGQESAQAIDRAAFNEALDEALSTLDENKRMTFEMRFRQELSIKEIAAAMDCSEGTVKSRLFYTLKALSGELQDYAQMRFEV